MRLLCQRIGVLLAITAFFQGDANGQSEAMLRGSYVLKTALGKVHLRISASEFMVDVAGQQIRADYVVERVDNDLITVELTADSCRRKEIIIQVSPAWIRIRKGAFKGTWERQ